MERWRQEETDPEARRSLQRGPRLGGEARKRERLVQRAGQRGEQHAGELRMAGAAAKAERMVGEELARWGWQEADLAARRKGDPDKPELAARLWRETTQSVEAIAARVHLGTSKAANVKLHRRRERSPATESEQRQFRLQGRILMETKLRVAPFSQYPIS